MIEQPDSGDAPRDIAHLAATWQDHPVVRLALFGAAFACGLVAIDVAEPPRADDLRFLWMTVVPFAFAFVVRHAAWPVAAVAAYYVGTMAPNAAYDVPLPALGRMQPEFPGMTAMAGMGIVWTVWGFRAGYAAATPPPVYGRRRARWLRTRLVAATIVYALGFAPILLTTDRGLIGPSLAWLALAPLLLAPLAPARLWPFAAGLVAALVVGWQLWTGVSPDWWLPVAVAGVAFAASFAWAMVGVGFLLAGAVERLRER